MDVTDALGLAGLAIAVATLLFGFRQYHHETRWKRLSLLLEECNRLDGDAKVQTALRLLDWNSVPAEDLPDRPPDDGDVSDPDLATALVPHQQKGDFSPREAWLRGVFDALLTPLNQYAHWVEASFITAPDLKPAFGYWLDILAHGQGPKGEALSTYVRAHYPALGRLLQGRGWEA